MYDVDFFFVSFLILFRFLYQRRSALVKISNEFRNFQ